MRNHQKLTLLFWHRKSKADAKGYAPVICRITIEGEEPEELAIGMKVHQANWDVENKKAKGVSHEKKVNLKISEVTADLTRDLQTLQTQYEHITPLMVKNVYKGLPATLIKSQPKPEQKVLPTLLQVSDLHIANFKKMVDKGLRSGETLKQWNATRKKIEEFLVEQYQLIDMDLGSIDFSFAVKFYNYLTLETRKSFRRGGRKKTD